MAMALQMQFQQRCSSSAASSSGTSSSSSSVGVACWRRSTLPSVLRQGPCERLHQLAVGPRAQLQLQGGPIPSKPAAALAAAASTGQASGWLKTRKQVLRRRLAPLQAVPSFREADQAEGNEAANGAANGAAGPAGAADSTVVANGSSTSSSSGGGGDANGSSGGGGDANGSSAANSSLKPLAADASASPSAATPPAAAAQDKEQQQGGGEEGETGWRRRWTIVALCFVAFMLCNMDRVNMSIAILPMSQEYGWSSVTMGLVQSSFFWGYLLTQVLGGVWADKYGGKVVLGFGVVWWSLATAFTPVAAKLGLPALLLARACMGIGEGVAMPAMNNLLSRWVPVRERSRSLALVYSGMYTGSIVGLAASPHVIDVLGWPSVFYIFGAAGVLWYLWWAARAASGPQEDDRVSESERAYIVANTATQSPVEDIPWKELLSKREVWALIVSHFCHNWGTFILLTWMPLYYNQVLGFDLMTSGLFSVLPWATMAVSANVGGWIADTLITKGVSITLVRKIMQTIGFLGPAFFLTQLSSVSSPAAAVGCMMASQGLDAFSQSGLYSNHQDIGPRYSGVLLGMSNTAGVLAGVLGTAATGWILQHGSWGDVWGVAVGLYLVGTVVWNLFASGEKVID